MKRKLLFATISIIFATVFAVSPAHACEASTSDTDICIGVINQTIDRCGPRDQELPDQEDQQGEGTSYVTVPPMPSTVSEPEAPVLGKDAFFYIEEIAPYSGRPAVLSCYVRGSGWRGVQVKTWTPAGPGFGSCYKVVEKGGV